MMTFDDRKKALQGLICHLNDSTFAASLVHAYMEDTDYLKKTVYEREVSIPSSMLKEVGNETEFTRDFCIDFQNLLPLGNVAVVLPGNGINMLIAKAVASSFLAGNNTIIKFPRRLKKSNPYFKELVAGNLPGVEFSADDLPAETFLRNCLVSPDIQAVVIYGDDKWIGLYKDIARRHNKKLIFEGPGKDPQIVMPDANLELAVTDAVKCGLLNGGQSCSAMERFFVHTDIAKDFIERLAYRLSMIRIGNPYDEEADLGPIRSKQVLERLVSQVRNASDEGAKIITGGSPLQIDHSNKYAFQPTVLTGCNKEMDIIRDENFGPVFPVMTFSSEEDLLNDLDCCNYGLNASVYGTCGSRLVNYLYQSHRNIYFNSTVTSDCNKTSRILDGGFKNSGFVWEWKGSNFLQREGRRMLLKELSAHN